MSCKPAVMGLGHADIVSSEWTELHTLLSPNHDVVVDGQSLSIPEVIAVCMRGTKASMTAEPRVLKRVEESVEFIDSELRAGRTIYGVNTGFGGSADVRTSQFEALQVALQQHLNVGILLPSDKNGQLAADEGLRSHALPVPVVRAMMLVRCNSLLRGHSGVRSSLIEAVLTLLSKGVTPVVPLRGSISASGDLSPLSYIAGLLEGNPDIHAHVITKNSSIYMTADKALEYVGLQPIRLRAKEGLGIMNGTATSCAAACIATYHAQQIAVMTQLLTAMGTEALLGTAHNYHPFISAVRPHYGQAEAASNILLFLSGSRLAPDQGAAHIGLAQDRYALRTAPQWIGPQLEDLILAHRQIQTEINSTTDNPLIDVANGAIHHGGNFQAAAVTSAMEKTMSAVQMFGKLLYAQCTELVNSQLNKGLPPNLSVDDPSTSFTFKGFDVNMAAYMSELAYLNHPISSHMHVTEMNNQSVNSLALVAARYALEATEVLSLMIATYLYALCQALDLRCLHLEFVAAAEPIIRSLATEHLGRLLARGDDKARDALRSAAWSGLLDRWSQLAHLDLRDRSARAAAEALGPLTRLLAQHFDPEQAAQGANVLQAIAAYGDACADALAAAYDRARTAFFEQQTTSAYLSTASRIVYDFVRRDLNVPFHRGLADHPTLPSAGEGGRERKIIGSMASTIYVSIRDGRMYGKTMEAFKAVTAVKAEAENLFEKEVLLPIEVPSQVPVLVPS